MVLAYQPNEVVAAMERAEHWVNTEQLTAAGFVSYEAAAGFDETLDTQPGLGLPLVCFGLFARVDECAPPTPATTIAEHAWQLDTPHQEYLADIVKIRELIAAGEVYQINHTLRLHSALIDPWQLFCQIALDAPYAAYIETDEFAIVSASPELFFRLQGADLQSRPMKGTVARRQDSEADKQISSWLSASQKNRAENLMITDMVRNDIGKIAAPGSVHVSGLFAVEAYPTVWQMTSTVHGETNASLVEIFRTLFPAASITGAPKRAAMSHIARLEKSPRGIYTGAIGYLAPNRNAQFSIAIRTSAVDKSDGQAQYGAGGGIVWDSTAAQEYVEMRAKTKILGRVAKQDTLELFETLRWTRQDGFSRLDGHLQRMANSASVFGYPMDREQAVAVLAQSIQGNSAQALRVRLNLSLRGEFSVDLGAVPLSQSPSELQSVRLATTPVESTDIYLLHKTSYRQAYDQALAEMPMGVEPILVNERAEITESNIANVVYKLGGQWFTPPLSSGLLPGVLRAELLDHDKVTTRELQVAELDAVQEVWLVNDLRGWRKTCWV